VGYNKLRDGLLSVGKIGHGDAASRVESFQRLGLPVRSSSEEATFVMF
jgi:hypothetical protein